MYAIRSYYVGQERQRHADHRQHAGHHAHVDEGVGEENQADRAREQAPEQRGGLRRDRQAARDQQRVEHEQDAVADQRITSYNVCYTKLLRAPWRAH